MVVGRSVRKEGKGVERGGKIEDLGISGKEGQDGNWGRKEKKIGGVRMWVPCPFILTLGHSFVRRSLTQPLNCPHKLNALIKVDYFQFQVQKAKAGSCDWL